MAIPSGLAKRKPHHSIHQKIRLECTAIRLRNQTICQYPTTSEDLTDPRVAETEVTFDFLRCEELS